MISLCIKNNNSKIINYLMDNIANIKLCNIYFSTQKFSKYYNVIIHYVGNSSPAFYNEISTVICNCIIKLYEPQIVRNILHSNYFYFDNLDTDVIENNCNNILKNDSTNSEYPLFANSASVNLDYDYDDRKKVLWTAVLKYITAHKSLVLDGFILFRAKEYLKYIDSAVDYSVNQFVIDKEYFDFINLLKLYVDTKCPLIDLVHLIYINNDSILLDKDKNVIATIKDNLDLNYLSDISFSYNDYALNTLLSLLPRKIVIHLISKEDEFINTLKIVFDKRIEICTDCNICKTYKLLNSSNVTNS